MWTHKQLDPFRIITFWRHETGAWAILINLKITPYFLAIERVTDKLLLTVNKPLPIRNPDGSIEARIVKEISLPV